SGRCTGATSSSIPTQPSKRTPVRRQFLHRGASGRRDAFRAVETERALLTLLHARLPDAALRHLLERYPEPTVALEAARHGGLAGLRGESLAALRRPDPASLAAGLDWLSRPRQHLLGWQDPDYPPLLRRSPNP